MSPPEDTVTEASEDGVVGAWWLMVCDDADGPLDVLDTCAQSNRGC